MSEFFTVFQSLVREFLARADDGEVDAIARLVRDEYRRRGRECAEDYGPDPRPGAEGA